ncbi:acid ceramidase-like [Dysidea avara]|uniref:acid ceramidase-like n=1 Tax=Dysidea avara TaxID=196820 RepID=UPI003326A18A
MMYLWILIALCLITTTSCNSSEKEACVTGAYPPAKEDKIPWYVINLDQPPDQRWDTLTLAKTTEMKAMIGEIKRLASIILNGSLIPLIDHDLAPLVDELPFPFGDEIKGIAKTSNIPLGEIVLYNIFYEIFTVCTSIVARDENGKMFHARNLDFGLFMGWDISNDTWALTELLRPLVVNLNFQQNGMTVFKTVNFAGYIGVLSGIKPGVFTLTMNERFTVDGGYIGLLEWVLGKRSGHWMSFLTRNTLSNADSFSEAVNMLANTEMLAPAYFILGGVAEGAVITRAIEKSLDIWRLSPTNDTWFLLETNYDHWKPAPVIDDRRTPGINCMNHMGQQELSLAGLFNVLSTRPVLNKLTTYTALMQVDEGYLESYLRYCPDPCWPW